MCLTQHRHLPRTWELYATCRLPLPNQHNNLNRVHLGLLLNPSRVLLGQTLNLKPSRVPLDVLPSFHQTQLQLRPETLVLTSENRRAKARSDLPTSQSSL